jgi:hypothetical protein|tara:strand:- start:359 stop:652 length:294 start_codon:yes stop_codon:yes gene_type:complete
MTPEEIGDYGDMIDKITSDEEEMPIRDFIAASFFIYELVTTDVFIDQYLYYLSDVPESELRAGIMEHISNEQVSPPIPEMVFSRIVKQRCPENQPLH